MINIIKAREDLNRVMRYLQCGLDQLKTEEELKIGEDIFSLIIDKSIVHLQQIQSDIELRKGVI